MTAERQTVTGDMPWPKKYTFVPAIRVGDTLYISGTTGTSDEGVITAPGDIEEQTRQIYRKFERLLHRVGGTCRDIVATTDFFTTTENFSNTARVRREFFGDVFPTSTGVLVAGLLRKDALIEISAVAVIGSGARAAQHEQSA